MRKPRASGALLLCVVAAAGFLCGIFGMEQTFGRLRPRQKPPLVYSVEVHDADGSLLANPLLVGSDDRSIHLDLSRPRPRQRRRVPPPLDLSLDLSPRAWGERAIFLEYRGSVDAGVEQRGRLALALGQRGSLALIRFDGEPVRLQVTVARAGSKAFREILRARRGKPVT